MRPFRHLIGMMWCLDKTKRQKDKKWKRQKGKKTKGQQKNTKRPKREFNIVTSGKFCTLAMFLRYAGYLNMMQYFAIFSRYLRNLKLFKNVRNFVQNLSWKHLCWDLGDKNVTFWFLATKMDYLRQKCLNEGVKYGVNSSQKNWEWNKTAKKNHLKFTYEGTQLDYQIAIG